MEALTVADSQPARYLSDLPHDLLQAILQLPAARSLSAAAQVSHGWQNISAAVVDSRLRHVRPWLLPSCPCRLRCLATVEEAVKVFGQPPTGSSWESENEQLRRDSINLTLTDAGHHFGQLMLDASFWFDFPLETIKEHTFVTSKVAAGWPKCHAFALAGMAGLHSALGDSIFAHRVSGNAIPNQQPYPASLRAWLDALSFASTRPPPPTGRPTQLWANLTGIEGLALVEGVWIPDLLDAQGVGARFITNAAVDAKVALRCHFRTDDGWYSYTGQGDGDADADFELQDHSPIVCFRCEADVAAGYRTLVYEPRPDMDDHLYHLPPFAHVLLERVDAPGTWEVTLDDDEGVETRRPRVRLYTVSVSFGC